MTVALMREARAAEGRGRELLAWARAQELLAHPLRRETFPRSPGPRPHRHLGDAEFDADLLELP